VRPLLQLLVPVLGPVLEVRLPKNPRRKRRRRVRSDLHKILKLDLAFVLTLIIEKEESDEDMGFGLFD